MKVVIIPICLSLLGYELRGQQFSSEPKLTGIIDFPGYTRAVIEQGNYSWIWAEHANWTDFQLVKIVPAEGRVDVILASTNRTLSLAHSSGNSTNAIVLDGADLKTVLRLYGELSEHTVLPFPLMPATTFILRTNAADKAEGARVIDRMLTDNGYVIIPDGEKFLMVLPKGKASLARPQAPRVQNTKKMPADSDIIPKGLINFYGVDSGPVAKIYAELLGKKLDRESLSVLPCCTPIFLRTENPLTKEEAIYTFETLFRWQDIKLIPADDGFVRAIKISEN